MIEKLLCVESLPRNTKLFKTTLQEAVNYYEVSEPKGECIIVVKGVSREELDKEARKQWESMSVTDHIKMYMSQGMDKKEATKQVAKDRGVPKRDIYEFAKEI